jgi:hypothetical protein
MKALKVTTNNEISVINLTGPLYQALQPEVGGWFEIVRARGLPQPYVMIVDEEGLLKDKCVNVCGCVLYGTVKHGSPIVGDIVIMREEIGLEEPDLFGLTPEDIKTLTSLCNDTLCQYATRHVEV